MGTVRQRAVHKRLRLVAVIKEGLLDLHPKNFYLEASAMLDGCSNDLVISLFRGNPKRIDYYFVLIAQISECLPTVERRTRFWQDVISAFLADCRSWLSS